jgi:hypothetical protein
MQYDPGLARPFPLWRIECHQKPPERDGLLVGKSFSIEGTIYILSASLISLIGLLFPVGSKMSVLNCRPV